MELGILIEMGKIWMEECPGKFSAIMKQYKI